MSLLRDRYEQTVRFSWLTRCGDEGEWEKYLIYGAGRANKYFRELTASQRDEFTKLVRPPGWITDTPTSDEKLVLDKWESTGLYDMAKLRDAAEPVGDLRLDRATLADLYTSIYRQASSISHGDHYALALLRYFSSPAGQQVLAAHPQTPAVACLHNALFDVIQCREISARYFNDQSPLDFDGLYARWVGGLEKYGIWPVGNLPR